MTIEVWVSVMSARLYAQSSSGERKKLNEIKEIQKGESGQQEKHARMYSDKPVAKMLIAVHCKCGRRGLPLISESMVSE